MRVPSTRPPRRPCGDRRCSPGRRGLLRRWSPADSAAKKKRCKKGRAVRVAVPRKRVSCVRARRVLPKPKRGDPRLLLARSAFGRDWSGVRGRRGKRAQSLPKLVRKLGPRAPRLLSRVTARGLGVIDERAAATAGAQSAATGCRDVPPGTRQQDSFTSSAGGVRATVTSTLGSDGAQLGMELTGNEFTITATLDFGACEPNEVEAPTRPTAAGQLNGDNPLQGCAFRSGSRGAARTSGRSPPRSRGARSSRALPTWTPSSTSSTSRTARSPRSGWEARRARSRRSRSAPASRGTHA